HVQQGSWCPSCHGTPPGDLERMRDIARRRGGECLSRAYAGNLGLLRWRCRERHVWSARPNAVVQGSWCRRCAAARGMNSAPLSLEDMQETAEARGGRCLSTAYAGAHVKLDWECASGHVWSAAPSAVRRGSWCPQCAHTYRGSIDGMRVLAA